MKQRDSGFGTRDSAPTSPTRESRIPNPESRIERPESRDDETTCPQCAESHDLAKVKGCIKCLKCGFKFDCNGW
jgi:hypothetical protein